MTTTECMRARSQRQGLSLEHRRYLGELFHVLDVDALATMGRDEVNTAAIREQRAPPINGI